MTVEGEGGGHKGDTPFSILITAVVNLCKNARSPWTGEPIIVVAWVSRTAAASWQLFRESLLRLCRPWQWHGLPRSSRYGADGIWVRTRFVASEEAGASPKHKEIVLAAGYDDIV